MNADEDEPFQVWLSTYSKYFRILSDILMSEGMYPWEDMSDLKEIVQQRLKDLREEAVSLSFLPA
jgi:hypothetical protein